MEAWTDWMQMKGKVCDQRCEVMGVQRRRKKRRRLGVEGGVFSEVGEAD